MKEMLMNILACPSCKSDLTLQVIAQVSDEIIKGTLQCESCDLTYKIEDSIPDFMPVESD